MRVEDTHEAAKPNPSCSSVHSNDSHKIETAAFPRETEFLNSKTLTDLLPTRFGSLLPNGERQEPRILA